MSRITTSRGDSITSIAEDRGFFWQTLWDHPENSELKQRRGDPNILAPGDEVFVPELEIKKESRPAEARHRFKKKGVPASIKLRLTRLNEPRANEPYVLIIDGRIHNGTTDGDGNIEHPIPPNARTALLRLQQGKEEYDIDIGGLDPYDTPTGVQQRLANMGFDPGDINGDLTSRKTVAAIKTFQNRHGLPVTGEADEDTIRKIDQAHV